MGRVRDTAADGGVAGGYDDVDDDNNGGGDDGETAVFAQRPGGRSQIVVQIVGSGRVATESRQRGKVADQQRDEAQVGNGDGQSQSAVVDGQTEAASDEQHADGARWQTRHGQTSVVAAAAR